MSVSIGSEPNSEPPVAMADITFHCPECLQRMASDPSAAGAEIACPLCRSVFQIPRPPPSIQPATLPERASSPPEKTAPQAHSELDRKERELAHALDEARQYREETLRSQEELKKLHDDFAVARWERDALLQTTREVDCEMNRLRGVEADFRRNIADLRAQLVNAIRDRESLAQRLDKFTASSAQPAPGAPEQVPKELEELRAALAEASKERARIETEAARSKSDLKELIFSLQSALQTHQAELRRLHENNARLEGERNTVQLQLSEATRRMEEMVAREEELVRLRNASSESASRLSAAVAERDVMQAELDERKDSVRKASMTIDAVRQELERLRCERREAVDGQEQSKGALDEALEEARELHERVDTLLNDVHRREQELATIAQQFATATAELEETKKQCAKNASALAEETSRSAQLREELEKRRATGAGASAEAARLRTAVVQLQEELAKERAGFKALQAEASRQDLAKSEIAAQLQIALHQRDEARHQLADRDGELRATSGRLWEDAAAANERSAELEKRLDVATRDAKAARAEAAVVREQLEEAAQKDFGREQAMRAIRAELERKETGEHTLRLHLEAAERNCATARERAGRLEIDHDAMQAELAVTRATFAQLNAELAETRSEREESRQELEALRERLQLMEEQRDGLNAELEATRAGLERAKQHVNALHSRRDELQGEIARLKMKMGLAPAAL